MKYVIAQRHSELLWYAYDRDNPAKGHTLIDTFDPSRCPIWNTKAEAKEAGKALGVGTWRYITLKEIEYMQRGEKE